MGSIGVVVGATADLAASGIDVSADPAEPVLPVLAPGFGHQGAEVRDLQAIYGSLSAGVIVSESRSLLGEGPDGIVEAIVRRADEIGAARV
jgi:orotidine-5'-phosphate decarboxylase